MASVHRCGRGARRGRVPRGALVVIAALGALTACGETARPCQMVAVVSQVAVTWRGDDLPYGADATYRLCVAERCASGAPLVYDGLARVAVRLPEGFDERRPRVRLTLSGGSGTPDLVASRAVTLRQIRAGCDRAPSGALRLTAEGELREAR